MSPKDVTVLGSLDVDDQSSVGSSAQLSTNAPVAASSSTSKPVSFVTAEQFEAMNVKWTEQFARFEALLSYGNVFTTAKTVVSSPPTTYSTLVSSQPFINTAAQHTEPVPPAVQESGPKGGESMPIKKAPESSKSDKAKPDFGTQTTTSASPVLDIPGWGHEIQEPVFHPLHTSSTVTADMGFQSTGPEKTTSQEQTATGSFSLFTKATKHTGQESLFTSPFEPVPYPPATAASSVSFSGPGYGVSDTDYRDLPRRIFLILSSPEMRILR